MPSVPKEARRRSSAQSPADIPPSRSAAPPRLARRNAGSAIASATRFRKNAFWIAGSGSPNPSVMRTNIAISEKPNALRQMQAIPRRMAAPSDVLWGLDAQEP